MEMARDCLTEGYSQSLASATLLIRLRDAQQVTLVQSIETLVPRFFVLSEAL